MQGRDDAVIEVGSAKRANAKNLGGENEGQKLGATHDELMKTELVQKGRETQQRITLDPGAAEVDSEDPGKNFEASGGRREEDLA